MKMLVKLGLEFLRHAQNGQAGHTHTRTAAEATDRAGTTPQDEDDAGNARTWPIRRPVLERSRRRDKCAVTLTAP